ncbi:sensor histidine kinase [Luteipulveratus sp. YIM 133132]|uniref:sensor histidine kinase n=1 Tax=Luteipulveratus flavus TaxID=3031728 RepID=UPI0023B05ED8|nr:sensor histidine kinase [Luteipulveratus sp. YIM 133132]MDE9365091.1 sensor histidine kinase [Luteipulveratus sp. YIM 133132]
MTQIDAKPGTDVATARHSGVVSSGLRAIGRGIALTGLALWEALLLLWVCLCACLVFLGIGVILLPPALDAVRSQARRQRSLAWSWSGVRVTENYLPDPTAEGGLSANLKRLQTRSGDPSFWKDLLWDLVNPFVGVVIAFVPAALVVNGLFGVAMPVLWGPWVSGWENSWYGFVPVDSFGMTFLAAALGLVSLVLGVVLAPFFIRWHGRWVATVLSTQTREQMQARMEHLSRSRSDAVAHEAQEIRRIERDLHDGAQARLVAMGMTLSAAERLIDENPAAARTMVQEAKETSSAALQELRELVRGIHPPVLADRGLVDAIRARALETPLNVQVRSDLQGRPLPPLESAVYFAVSELLTNAAKHSGADQIVVTIAKDGGTLRVTVEDNGRGGVRIGEGTGLRGVERRLAAFDGDLLVHSPQGGPTTMTVVVPCTLAPRDAS